MYGMVNKAVRGYVLKNFDLETWQRIHQHAEVDGDFTAMQAYDDDVTYRLVASAHELLGVKTSLILNGFGRYWVSDVATAAYGDLMSKTGVNFRDFVKNLDHLHERIRVTFPDYSPPSFRVKDLDDGLVQLDYYSHREGLSDFVVGLLEGLGEHFNEGITVEKMPDDSHPMPCTRFKVWHGPLTT